MEDELEQTIRDSAQGPKHVKGDSGEVEQHSLTEQIEVDRYLNSKKAAKSKRLGIRITKLVPPGAE